jgi:hypothetical protein
MTWTVEEHELSEGYSCIVYDEHGQAVADHLDRKRASLIAAAPELYAACEEALAFVEMIEAREDTHYLVGGNIAAALAKARGEQ